MKSKNYLNMMQIILQNIDEGVHVIDKETRTVIYNRGMEKIEGMMSVDVVKKPLLQVFKSLDKDTSTLTKVLKTGKVIENQKQTYLNKDGKEVTTINTTVPIELEGEIIGAVEIAKNITNIKELSDTIISLQREISSPKATIKNKIQKYTFENISGSSIKFLEALKMARRASDTSASILIWGETGTGKELFAQSIHYAGNRKDAPFLAQNCSALPESLLEGILFGTSKGGFTGAVDRPGLFEQANGGTLLLDEINSMEVQLQSKLLRVLQEGYVRRVGGTSDIPVDVRVIATTNENPRKLIEEGKMRKDLYYRINVIQIDIPPLRQRKDDIPLLCDRFLKKYNEKFNKKIEFISEEAVEVLREHSWPGNVRELENVIQGAISMVEDDSTILEKEDLKIRVLEEEIKIPTTKEGTLDEIVSYIEKNMIIKALEDNDNNITKSAEKLGIKRQTLQHKIKKYNISMK